jgi:hypothetical protein
MNTRALFASLALFTLATTGALRAQINATGATSMTNGPGSFDGSQWEQYRNDTGHTVNIHVYVWSNLGTGWAAVEGDPGVPTLNGIAPGGTFWLATYSYGEGSYSYYSEERAVSYYEIVKVPVTITWTPNTGLFFNGSTQTGVTYQVSPAGAASVSGETGVFANNYTANATLANSDDYYWGYNQQTSCGWNIAKAPRSLSVSGTNNTYTNTPASFYATGPGAGTIQWTNGSTGGFADYSWGVPGNYTVSATVSGDPNYQDASGSTGCSVFAPKTYSVTVKIAGDGAQAAGCSASANPPSGISQGGYTTLSANAASGWQFTGWTGDSPNNITSDITVIANFAPAGTTSATISASPSSAIEPGSTTVSWSTSNATSVSVSGDGVSSSAVSGSQSVTGLAAGSYTYTITASGPSGSTTQTATFTVSAAAPANVDGWISVSPASATAPGATTVSWSTSNATSISVSGNGVNSSAANGSQYVSGLSAGSYTYTLTAQGPGGPITRTATFTVSTAAQPNVNGSISVSPTSSNTPGATTVSWSTSNASSVSVSGNGVNSLAGNGSQYVSGLAAGSYTYTLTAQGSGGPITRTTTFTVTAGSPPIITISPLPTLTYNPYNGVLNNPQAYFFYTMQSPGSTAQVTGVGTLPNGTSGPLPFYTQKYPGYPARGYGPFVGFTLSQDVSADCRGDMPDAFYPHPTAGTYTIQITATNASGTTTKQAQGQIVVQATVQTAFTVLGATYQEYDADTGETTDILPPDNGWSINPDSKTGLAGDSMTFTVIPGGSEYRFVRWQDAAGNILGTNPALSITAKGGMNTYYACVTQPGNEVPLTFTLSGSKTYDGTTAATGATAVLTAGSLNLGDTISYAYTPTPSPTVGSYPGLVTATIHNASNADVTWNYGISYAGSYTISKAAQPALTLASLTAQTYGTSRTFTVGGGGGSGAITDSLASGPATRTATLAYTANSGTTGYTVSVTKAGDTNYLSRTDTFAVPVAKADQVATLTPLASTVPPGTSIAYTAAGGATGVYVWSGTAGASGGGAAQTVTPVSGLGSYTVTVYAPGDSNYNDSPPVTATIVMQAQTLALSLIPLVSNYTVNDANSPLNGKTYKRVWQDGGAWHAYLGRSGDQFQIVGQATTAVQTFELQALEPNADPSAWYSLATIPPPSGATNGPGISVTGVFSVSLDTASAAAALVPQSYVQGNPKTGVWQLRARTQDSSGTWSDWSNVVAVTVDLPLTTKAVSAQTLPPAGPIGGWFTASDQTTFNLPVWIP